MELNRVSSNGAVGFQSDMEVCLQPKSLAVSMPRTTLEEFKEILADSGLTCA